MSEVLKMKLILGDNVTCLKHRLQQNGIVTKSQQGSPVSWQSEQPLQMLWGH